MSRGGPSGDAEIGSTRFVRRSETWAPQRPQRASLADCRLSSRLSEHLWRCRHGYRQSVCRTGR